MTERNHPIGLAVDIKQCWQALARVRSLDAIVVPPHDPKLLKRYPTGVVVG